MIEIVPFRPQDQDAVRVLILAGLEEHWGYLDGSKNPDLQNIAASYAQGAFLVAWLNGEIVGTGAFRPHSADAVKVVRMSVARHLRRLGIGRQILDGLCKRAVRSGYERVILETTKTWLDVIEFYRAFGFRITHYTDDDVYFVLDLQDHYGTRPSCEPDAGRPHTRTQNDDDRRP
jgi:putative acetyltransferase